MFERNRSNPEQGALSVELVVGDGAPMRGRLMVPAGRALFDVLNGSALFLEFEPFDGERQFIAKASLRSVKMLAGAGVVSLAQKVRDLDGFDPYSILGVAKGTAPEDIRASYVTLARQYHPDRFATAQLPPEVASYLEGMSQRVNAAYETLQPALTAEKARSAYVADTVYVSRGR